jgi:hypothetical protein
VRRARDGFLVLLGPEIRNLISDINMLHDESVSLHVSTLLCTPRQLHKKVVMHNFS